MEYEYVNTGNIAVDLNERKKERIGKQKEWNEHWKEWNWANIKDTVNSNDEEKHTWAVMIENVTSRRLDSKCYRCRAKELLYYEAAIKNRYKFVKFHRVGD